ncbi:VOC family protein [Flavobacterium pallidum]|uniref:VOC domain-containing protein n=1 Tax=Flavobacterium pallidum TaxID=2172098 RepID=A0A2S1SIT5_9FLAO|nr:VOC family protein [Flavobacterium pallidum]AWI26318.1 hypothetical protein HYN49_10630 [Flavobacterium pallidum]
METQSTPLTFPNKNTEGPFSDIKVGHIAIRTADYKGLIAWYQEKLSFRLIREWTAGDMQLAFIAPANDNDVIIEILGTQQIPDAEPIKTGYDHICFNVGNLEHTIQALTASGIEIVRCFPVPAIGKKVAFIADPEGNRIEFCEDLIL